MGGKRLFVNFHINSLAWKKLF